MLKFREGVNRYQALRELRFSTTDRRQLEPIPAGSKVSIITRGYAVTDSQGKLVPNGWGSGAMLANMLRHVWEIWAMPCLDEMSQSDEAVPENVSSITFLREDGRMRMRFNRSSIGQLKLRQGTVLKRGDAVLASHIVDFGPMTPPEWQGKATAYLEMHFRDQQMYFVLDCRPNAEGGLQAWDDESMQWYGRAHGDAFFAMQWGNMERTLPGMTRHDIPFSVEVDPGRMLKLARFASIPRVRAALVETHVGAAFGFDDWSALVDKWAVTKTWQERANALRQALDTYRHGLYHACVSTLTPQVEGIINDFLVARGKGLQENKQPLPWPARLDELEEILRELHQGPVLARSSAAAMHHLRNSSLYRGFAWTTTESLRSRHASAHGHARADGTKAFANRLFLLLSSLHVLLA